MLKYAINNTLNYINDMPKAIRKKYGQFFTSENTAKFMASLFELSSDNEISILDPGSGTGILSCAILDRINDEHQYNHIHLVCYENDECVYEVLKANLENCQNVLGERLHYEIITDNYITSQYLEYNDLIGANPNAKSFDIVIGNPPYMKIGKTAPEAKSMSNICYGAPNMYFLFSAMGLFNLKTDGELVFIIPRSWTSGAYFKAFRKYFLTQGKLLHIHLFTSRDKVFDKESVLQETIIIKVKKTFVNPREISITESNSNDDFDSITRMTVPYDLVVSGENLYVYLITNNNEVEVLNKLHAWQNTLPDLGLRMKTGLTVDFRNYEDLRDYEEDGAVPLFYSQHINEGRVVFPIKKEHEYVLTKQKGLIQDNKNYLFVKRFTAKEERRRLQCGIYLSKEHPKYNKISTQNKINFIDGINGDMSECLVYGLYVLFNSSLYDSYYRILNGSTQVNSTEINTIPVPNMELIQEMGRILMQTNNLSEENCNDILERCCA